MRATNHEDLTMKNVFSTGGADLTDGTAATAATTPFSCGGSATAGRRAYVRPELRRLGVLQSCAGSQDLAGTIYNPFFTPGGSYNSTPSGP